MYVSTHDAKQHYGVSSDTLRRWAANKQIKFIRTEGGHRRYFVPDVEQKVDKILDNIIYARVSSAKQKSDLQHQIQFLSAKFPNHKVISEIGSGLNFGRKGLQSLLDGIFKRNIKEIVVAHKDRLARFGFELIQNIFNRFGAKIIVVEHDQKDYQKDYKEEFADDIMSIVTHFSAKYSGKRRYTKKHDSEQEQ